ncbi:MAG: hypothetical protein HYS12_08500 [Planctomycetes bacterium]|nr:hypothetical protein [Planctomycetota bacterium]
MSIVVYAEASSGTNPGHMVVGQEPSGGAPCYFGYRFDLADLPKEYRPQEKWRDYLFTYAIPGKIVDETAYVSHLLALGETARTYYEKRAECGIPIESRLPPRQEWEPHAWYSLNPDDPRPGQEPCYNCVKWGITIANSLVECFLPSVRQGRLKLILEHLQKRFS